MIASSFEGMFLSLGLCIMGCISIGVTALVLRKSGRKVLGLIAAIVGLIASTPFLLESIYYGDQMEWAYNIFSVVAFIVNLIALVWCLFLKAKPSP